MPRVPRIDERGTTQGLQLPRFGGQLDSNIFRGATSNQFQGATNQLTSTVNNILVEEKRKADNLAVTEGQNMVDSFYSSLMTSPDNGLLTRQGKNAFGINEEFEESFDSETNNYLKNLANDDQKAALGQYIDRKRIQAQGQINGHMHKQIFEYDRNETLKGIDNAVNSAASNYRDLDLIGEELSRIDGLVDAHVERQGLGSEMAQAMKDEAKSSAHSEVLNRMMANGEDLRAQAYFRASKDQILGSKLDDIEKSLEESSRRGESQRRTDAIISENLSLEDSLSKAREIDDPKLRDETVNRVRGRIQERQAQLSVLKEQAYLEAVNAVEANPGRRPQDLVPPQIWSKLSISERKALNGFNGESATDPKAWFDFYTLTLDTNALGSMPVSEFHSKFYTKFNTQDRKRAETLYRQAVEEKKNGVSGSALTSVIPFNDKVLSSMQRSGLISESDLRDGKSKLSNSQFKTFRRITEEAQRRLNDFEQAKGKKATPIEQQELVDDILTEQAFRKDTLLGFDFLNADEQVIPALVEEDDRRSIYVPIDKISDDDLADIQQALRLNGQQVTDEKVEMLKGAQIMGDYERVQRILRGEE